MLLRSALCTTFLTAVAAVPALGQPGGNLIAGNTQYGQTAAPTAETAAGPSNTAFLAGTNVPQMSLNWWFYRVQGDSRERPFGTYTKSDGFAITGTSSYPPLPPGGNTASYQWTENGPSGTRFTATYTTTLSAGHTQFDSTLHQTFEITNPTPVPLTIFLYDLAFWEPGNHFTGVTGSLQSDAIAVTDGVYEDTHTGPGALAYQASGDASLVTLLTNSSVNDLNNTGLPFAGNNFNDAFEWALTVPPNQGESVTSDLVIAHVVPEPSTMLFSAAAAIAALACWPSRSQYDPGGRRSRLAPGVPCPRLCVGMLT